MTNEEIKIVLEELLEEQKLETLAKGEMIALLKQALDKLNTIEKHNPEQDSKKIIDQLNNIQSSWKRVEDKIGNLERECTRIVSQPVKKGKVIPVRLYWKMVTAILVFFAFSVFLFAGLDLTSKELNLYKAEIKQAGVRDLKYRFFKTSSNKAVRKLIMSTDSLYGLSPQLLIDSVSKAEKRDLK